MTQRDNRIFGCAHVQFDVYITLRANQGHNRGPRYEYCVPLSDE